MTKTLPLKTWCWQTWDDEETKITETSHKDDNDADELKSEHGVSADNATAHVFYTDDVDDGVLMTHARTNRAEISTPDDDVHDDVVVVSVAKSYRNFGTFLR